MRTDKGQGRRFTVSLVAGLLLVPAAAAVAFLLVDHDESAASASDLPAEVPPATGQALFVAAPLESSHLPRRGAFIRVHRREAGDRNEEDRYRVQVLGP